MVEPTEQRESDARPGEPSRRSGDPDTADMPLVSRRHEFVVVTGLSGAGRSTASNVLQDTGWYVTDNLPPQMLAPMATLLRDKQPEVLRVAAVVDAMAMRAATPKNGPRQLMSPSSPPTSGPAAMPRPSAAS